MCQSETAPGGTMKSVSKADIELQLVAYLVLDEPLYDRPISEVHRVVVACASVIADALKIEDREDAEDLEEMIAFTRRSFKVRECDRRDLTTTLNEAMGDSLFDLLPKVDRQKLTERIEGVVLTAELP
jgi:hypothetical protein